MFKAAKLQIKILIATFIMMNSASITLASDFFDGWKGDIFAGYNQTQGNTEKASGSMAAKAVKDFDSAEFLIKGSLFYSESENKMDGQKWDGLAKYFFDFGENQKWFNFYQIYVDHDYFADIDYRITPSTGLGYHIASEEDFSWDVDAGLGYRITRNRVNKSEDDEVAIAQLHTYINKKIFSNAFISEDLTVYPGLEGNSGVQLKSETALSNPLTEKIDLEFKYIVDYNSEASEGKKKTDTQIIAGIKYKF